MAIETAVETQGATTEPVTAVGGSGDVAAQSTQSAEPSGSVNWDSLDLGAVPKSFVAKVEQKYLGDMQANETRKQQALAEERRALQRERETFFDKFASRLAPEQAQPDELSQLRERVKQGDYEVVTDLIQKELAQKLGPIQRQNEIDQAVATAESRHPWVKEKAQEINQFLASNPTLAAMAFSNAGQNLPVVLEGIAIAMERDHFRSQLEANKASQEATIAARVKEELAKLTTQARSLPTTTSMAGRGPTGIPNPSNQPMTMKQRAVAYYDSVGKEVDPELRRQAARGL